MAGFNIALDNITVRRFYLLIFVIPLNIFILGRELGAGIQWVFFRYLETGYGKSLILFTRPFEYVASGTITGRSAYSEMILFLALLLFIISFILLQPSVSGNLRLPGLFTMVGALFVLGADMLQSGLLFTGTGATYIPVGIPLVLLFGYLMYHANHEEIPHPSPDLVASENNPEPDCNNVSLKKASLIASESTFWKVSYITLAVLVITMCLGVIIPIIIYTNTGWDFEVYMGGVAAWSDGKDPYSLDTVSQYPGTTLRFAYPPHTLVLFWFFFQFYQFFQSMEFYYVILLLLLLIAALILIKTDTNVEYLLLTVLLISAFSGSFFNFLTGNIALLYLVLSALFFFLIIHERFILSTLVMGIFSSFSLFPVIFNGIYLAAKRPIRDRVIYILASLGVASAILLVSWWINPHLFLSYIQKITSTASPAYETGGISTPTPFSFIIDLVKSVNIQSPLVIDAALLCYTGIILAATIIFLRKNRENPVAAYSFIFISIFLLMPRVKPYYFAMLIVPLYFLLKDSGSRTKCIALAIVSLFPVLCLLSEGTLLNNIPSLITDYSQAISLIVFFAFIFLNPDEKVPE
jgi:hypothetical protein